MPEMHLNVVGSFVIGMVIGVGMSIFFLRIKPPTATKMTDGVCSGSNPKITQSEMAQPRAASKCLVVGVAGGTGSGIVENF